MYFVNDVKCILKSVDIELGKGHTFMYMFYRTGVLSFKCKHCYTQNNRTDIIRSSRRKPKTFSPLSVITFFVSIIKLIGKQRQILTTSRKGAKLFGFLDYADIFWLDCLGDTAKVHRLHNYIQFATDSLCPWTYIQRMLYVANILQKASF